MARTKQTARNLLEEKLHENNLPPKPQERVHQQLVESRNHIDTDLVPSLSVKSEDTKNPLNCSSENCPSNAWFVKLLKTSRLTCDSKAPLSLPFKKHLKLTSLDSSKTPTCVPSMQNVSLSCQRTSNWPEESVENVPKSLNVDKKNGYFYSHTSPKKQILIL
jgi:hypothetical protein